MNIDDLILSGAFFSQRSRSASPARSRSNSRSPSPDPLFPSNDAGLSDPALSPLWRAPGLPPEPATLPPHGLGLGRTGVKGVLGDHHRALSLEKARRAQEIRETNRRMERMALTARTYAEDEAARLQETAHLAGRTWTDDDSGSVVGTRTFERVSRFGHLREIGEAGFLDAIEGELAGTWVVLHIYDPSLARCHDVDAVLARLARQYPQTKFLRARADAVGFATTTTTASSSRPRVTAAQRPAAIPEGPLDEHLHHADPHLYGDDADEEEEEVQVVTDTDLLPTLLVYRGGQIVHTWVRVDWEAEEWTKKGSNVDAGTSNIEALLRGHNIIQPLSNGNCGFSSDEDDLILEPAEDDVDDDDLFDL